MNNVLSTNVSIYRNVKDYRFVPKIDEKSKTEIIEKVETAFKDEMTKINLQNSDTQLLKTLIYRGVKPASPSNILISKNKDTIIDFFNIEHLTIISSCLGFDKQSLKNAYDLAEKLANKISLSYSDQYGYLMSDLSHLGAGIRIVADIDLSGIKSIGKIDQVKQNIKKMGYNLSEKKGNIYTMSTTCNLGFTSEEIFDEYEKMLTKLQDIETESVKMLDLNQHDELLDKTARTHAILSSAHMMSYDELNVCISNLRMAKNLNLTDVSIDKINKLHQLTVKTDDFVTKSELIDLAQKTNKIIKGE